MITIVDYGLGNLGSVANMLKKIGVPCRVCAQPDDVAAATALILPGVGHFDTGMKNLHERGLAQVLAHQVVDLKVPILGICLGMQLLARRSAEGSEAGLGWLAADVQRLQPSSDQPGLAIPHMGWNTVEARDELLFRGPVDPERRYYFVHSYHLVADDPSVVAAWANYGVRFSAAVHQGNVAGVQFHPEKSHKYGMALLRNWATAALDGSVARAS